MGSESVSSKPETPASITRRSKSDSSSVVKLRPNDQIIELQTILRDKSTSQSDFVFYADRLIRLLVEEGLNQLPFARSTIRTPTGCEYAGIQFLKGNCGVSVGRSGEAMEKGLRECCRSIRIGKILLDTDPDTHEPLLLYARLIPDISRRRVLLLYPILSTGSTVTKAMHVLKQNGCEEENILLLTLFCTQQSLKYIEKKFPALTVVTTEVHPTVPSHFGTKYFGTD